MDFLKKYYDFIETGFFKDYVNRFSEAAYKAIGNNYSKREPKVVKALVDELNNEKLDKKYNGIHINTNSIFIHGYNISQSGSISSGVRFKHYTSKVGKELGDLILLIDYKYNNRRVFNKITINQVKKAKKGKTLFSWVIDKKQLFLLSRFPSFHGIKGSIIPNKNYNLIDKTKTLGTYFLLHSPGDLIYTSAKNLDSILRNLNKKTFNSKDIDKLKNINENINCSLPTFPISDKHIDLLHHYYHELLYLFEKYLDKNNMFQINFPYFFPFCNRKMSSCHYADNLSVFSEKYIAGKIGEPLFIKKRVLNEPVKDFFISVFNNIKKSTKDKKIINFLNNINFNEDNNDNIINNVEGDFNFEGGIGIIYTCVNLGSEE